MVHLSNQVLTGLPGIYTSMEVLTEKRSNIQSEALPPMVGGTRLCLYVFLVVNSSTIRHLKGENNVGSKNFLYFTREITTS